jgi:hypothetical protein
VDVPLSDIPRLRWVLIEGNLCEVSAFRDLPPKARPDAYCPVCERQVTLKLGQKRVHHFAHRPEDICSATKPETAIHLNCKFYIYQQLVKATNVYTSSSCSRCGKQKSVLWKQDWDHVEVEYKMESLRPDIALLQNGKVIGAIEIFVTHAVNEEKAQRFQSQDVDWIEIYGDEGIYEEPNAWTAEKPLDAISQYPQIPSWTCSQCERVQEREKYQKVYHVDRVYRVEIICARMIDLYYPSGKKYRHVFYVKQAFTNGEKSRLWIEDEQRKIIADERAPITEQSRQRVNEAFKRAYQEFTHKAVFVDDSMDWIRWGAGRKFVSRDLDNFPFRYLWQKDTRTWVKQPGVFWKRLD